MHYYQFNIKDYSFATIRMSLMEDLAFRRMLDLFYESEKPLPHELSRVAKLIGMKDYQEEIRDVLNEFWNETESGWVNDRANEEIAKYQAKADSARVNGKKGGRPVKPKITQSVNLANPEKSESKANHKPITNNQEPIKDNTSFINDGFEHWWLNYPKKADKKKSLAKFKVITKGWGDERFTEFVNMITKDCKKRFANTEKSFIPNATTYLNGERWNDEY